MDHGIRRPISRLIPQNLINDRPIDGRGGPPLNAMNMHYESSTLSVLVCSQAIDDQVEQLAVGVGKTLSSVWGGIGGAMKKVLRTNQLVE